MFKQLHNTFAILALALFAAPVIAQGDVEAVMKQINEKQASIKSLKAKFETVMEMKTQGYSSLSRSKGSLAYRIPEGGERQSRMEQETNAVTKVGGQETKSKSSVLSIDDGAVAWTLSEQNGNKSAMKMKRQKSADDAFEAWRKSGTLALLADAKVNGQDAWVIKYSVTGGGSDTHMYHLKDSGFLIKSVTFGADGKPLSTTTYTDIEINPGLSDDLFQFKAPAGVEVQDLSNG